MDISCREIQSSSIKNIDVNIGFKENILRSSEDRIYII